MSITIHETDDIAACIALRMAVFVDEQGISVEEEIDDLDDAAVHLIAMDDGRPVGTARLLFSGETGKIGRVCVLQSHRGTGLGAELIEASIAYFRSRKNLKRAYLSAQVYAIPFYEKAGFAAYGAPYDDAGIPHRDMERVL
ncbi:GNAT family N-acetyltransferase [Falsihalocynthiibacter sp. SS001]|uniref:GNAT family N-acetyltransferase n=1 Tax=Falsihalocynthiibacter sp. SS001 TaxID=3349698 RepID=UPI0036D3C090